MKILLCNRVWGKYWMQKLNIHGCKKLKKMVSVVGKSITRFTLNELKSRISHVASLAHVKRQHDTVTSMLQPKTWVALQPHVNKYRYSKILSMTRAGNMRLGNRMKKTERCPGQVLPVPMVWNSGYWCSSTERHVILTCRGVKAELTT